ncbi:unnamed protein product [Adineta steineri]|uniref:Uncharacterized protein n=1 Tax=Adineta steineri TaxID=433720 RepID=A0A819MJ15_9BILA|nr:unnamed protein product [Adineta steineri]CAF3981703.1 unnamed protein product [Adineta steineri]
MAMINNTTQCFKCNKEKITYPCEGCSQRFCFTDLAEHKQLLNDEQNHIINNYDQFKQRINEQKQNPQNHSLIKQIDQWETNSIGKIQQKAQECRNIVIKSSQRFINDIEMKFNDLSEHIKHIHKENEFNEINLNYLTNQLRKITEELNNPSNSSIQQSSKSFINEISIILSKTVFSKPMRPLTHIPVTSQSQMDPYPSTSLITSSLKYQDVRKLFDYLRSLSPMDKNGPMSGDCDAETTQMERFLYQTFDFKNQHKYIVQGVKSFRLGKPLKNLDPQDIIYFPNTTEKSFAMTVQEILGWQHSFKVYADQTVKGMNSDFICKALQGLSESGKEAFRMKFVVRISQCPILMEFDACLITRELKDQWPSRIKLVSVTGIDFAGRIHDIDDIRTYVSNWKDVYVIDPKTGLPFVYNGRDFHRKHGAPRAELDEDRLLTDLIRMARLRLYACDKEKVQIVVETGIGLGVFAGKSIGIDAVVRALSAKAIRTVLEQEGPNYEHIRGIVFALPIFNSDIRNGRRDDVYQAFVDEFDQSKYNGCIPVLIADQDMHRLTVAIAREDFSVSELNPADSHGVFGEYWQNRGPAVEEKLALTTLGLLVQHHLINPHVLDLNHYHLIQV